MPVDGQILTAVSKRLSNDDPNTVEGIQSSAAVKALKVIVENDGGRLGDYVGHLLLVAGHKSISPAWERAGR